MSIFPKVAVITSTYKRPSDIIDRCIRSVQWQTYGIDNIIHYICHDGCSDTVDYDYTKWKNVLYTETPEVTCNYGAGVRQYILDTYIKNSEDIKYILHLDDDNILFPEFIKTHIDVLEANKDADFSICEIIHLGPLPSHLGRPPQVITGIPPVYQNIDTLQVVARKEAMMECGWTQNSGIKGYCNDGSTFEKLGKMFKWTSISKLLAVHI